MEASNSDRFSKEFHGRSVCDECALTNIDRTCEGCEMSIEDFTVLPREE
jgi:hypothetical protein